MTDIEAMPEVWQDVYHRVLWWVSDMHCKPPELLNGKRGDHYFECMAQDIANEAVGAVSGSGPPRIPHAQADYALRLLEKGEIDTASVEAGIRGWIEDKQMRRNP